MSHTQATLDRLEYYFFQLVGKGENNEGKTSYDRELSYEIVDALKTLTPPDGVQFINAFVEGNREKLAILYREYKSAKEYRHALLFKPESILIFALLATEKYKLPVVWVKCGYSLKWLEALAIVWGKPLNT